MVSPITESRCFEENDGASIALHVSSSNVYLYRTKDLERNQSLTDLVHYWFGWAD